MPFDGSDPQDPLDPLSVVDRLWAVLADETNWEQGSFGSANSHCLYGWLNIIDHGTVFWWNNEPFDFRTEAASMVHRHIMRRTTPLLYWLIGQRDRISGLHFNDNNTHKAMMQMIVKVRRGIVGCRC